MIMTMEKKDGAYADPSMKVVIIPTDTPTEATMHALEDGAATLIEGDSCVVVQDGGTMTPIAPEGSCFELKVGTGDMSTFNMDTTGMTGFAAFTAHSPYEFENNQHYLKDSSGNDVEHVAEEGGGGHDDHGHGDHGDEDGHGDDHDDEMTPELALQSFDSNNDSHISWGEFWAGWTSDDHDDHGDDDHDDHDDEHESKIYDGCTGSTDPHDAYYECWMDDWLDEDGNIIMSDGYDEEECTELANYSWECEHHDPFEEAMEEYVADLLMQSFNQSDSDGDTLLSVDELANFIEEIEHLEDDLESATTQIMISVFDDDEDGNLSMSEFFIFMETMDDGHDGHGDEDDHDHGDEDEDDHDDHNETEVMEITFNMFDTNSDGYIDASELELNAHW